MQYFISAIGTDSGKTVVSAIFARACGAAYWKPVQAGNPKDSDFIRSVGGIEVFPERYQLKTPASPHYAAEIDQVKISLDDFELPDTENLIVEGAGGLMVPLNRDNLIIDLADKWEMPVVLVCNLYLGSINHSLLSIEYLKRRQISVAGIVFNGPATPSSEKIIEKHCPWPVLLHIPTFDTVDSTAITLAAEKLQANLSANYL